MLSWLSRTALPVRNPLSRSILTQIIRKKPMDLSKASQARILPQDKPVEEEQNPEYDAARTFPVKLGDVHKGYEVVTKIGSGEKASIFLARSVSLFKKTRYVTLKFCHNYPPGDRNAALDELSMSYRIAKQNPSQIGVTCTRYMQDAFRLHGPNGRHWCFVYQPMRGPSWVFQRHLEGQVYPFWYLGLMVRQLLFSLSYLHEECHIVHANIKPENVLLELEDSFDLAKIVHDEEQDPSPRKLYPDRTIYMSRSDWGVPADGEIPGVKLSDFGSAYQLPQRDYKLTCLAQPEHYRAPEVILRAPWSYPADIWNLGVMLWDLAEGRPLFHDIHPYHCSYTHQAHLARIIGYLGLPPKELLDRGSQSHVFFDGEGKFALEGDTSPRALSGTLTKLAGEEKAEFLRFVSRMLVWDPEKRATARGLLQDPWLLQYGPAATDVEQLKTALGH